MKAGLRYLGAISLVLITMIANSQQKEIFSFEFCGNTLNLPMDPSFGVSFDDSLSEKSIRTFYNQINSKRYLPLINALLDHKEKFRLNDWVYYQLIRKTAQQISPKNENYLRYTLYKWFLLSKSGYDARLTIVEDKLLFYVRNNEDISDIPFYINEGRQYMCLNYHDYLNINFEKSALSPVNIYIPEGVMAFSYRVTQLPDFNPDDYSRKTLQFNYRQRIYSFDVMITPQISTLFTNYPGVDFESYFNIPLSRQTYVSLIPALKENIREMSQKRGVDYLMRFTRNALMYETDEQNFGKEKRLSPELTLFSEYSDCDDRAGLFFYLVKEIYNLPMIAVLYPTHVTIAVQLDKPVGKPITYKGKKFSICEPTPQVEDLRIGQIAEMLHAASYEVVYHYDPDN